MRDFLVLPLCALILLPTLAVAEDTVPPPPVVEQSSEGVAGTVDDAGESPPNLKDELGGAGADSSSVDVRSYKRKDGATVTEYSLHGQIYEIKVQPAGGFPAYYLYRNKAGHFERRRPGTRPVVTPPSWMLKQF